MELNYDSLENFGQSMVFSACAEGSVQKLKHVFMKLKPKNISALVHGKMNGATPLVIAAQNGHIEIVKYLIEQCKADFTQTGCVKIEGETIEGAPPLWCAAAAGYLNIVTYLVARGADVNQTTFTNSTPLRAACFDGYLSIVKFLVDHNADIEIANRHGHTCLMIACYKGHKSIVEYLISKNAKVNRRSVKGNTALHDSAESGSLEVLKLLLANGAIMEKDSYEMTPLMASAVAGYKNVLDYLVSLPSCSRYEFVNALELLGATYVDKKRDTLAAIKIWRRALMERKRLGRLPYIEKPKVEPKAAYLYAVEACQEDELEEMISDPDEMRMQALLIRERVLGPRHPDTSYYIRYRGALYADLGNFERCITLWMYALEMQQSVLEPLNTMTMSSFLSFAELFAFILIDQTGRLSSLESKDKFSADILAVLELGETEIRRHRLDPAEQRKQSKEVVPGTGAENDKLVLNRLLVILLHLMNLMNHVPSRPDRPGKCSSLEVTEGTDSQLLMRYRRWVYRLVKLDVRGNNGASLLHMACMKDTTNIGRYPVCSFPDSRVVELLLHVGADPNSKDTRGTTPLHMAAEHNQPDIVQLLLDSGAHADMCDVNHISPLDHLHRLNVSRVCAVKNTSLKCLASRVIMHQKLPFKDSLSPDMIEFVMMH